MESESFFSEFQKRWGLTDEQMAWIRSCLNDPFSLIETLDQALLELRLDQLKSVMLTDMIAKIPRYSDEGHEPD